MLGPTDADVFWKSRWKRAPGRNKATEAVLDATDWRSTTLPRSSASHDKLGRLSATENQDVLRESVARSKSLSLKTTRPPLDQSANRNFRSSSVRLCEKR